MTATVTKENPQGIGGVEFNWSLSEETGIELEIRDSENGDVVENTTLLASESGTETVDSFTDGQNAGGNREPRPIEVVAIITETGERYTIVINDGDGDGPFTLSPE